LLSPRIAFLLQLCPDVRHPLAQARDVIVGRFELAVIGFDDAYYSIDEVRKTAAAFPLPVKGAKDLGRDDDLPRVFVEQADDRLLHFLLADDVALADEQGGSFVPRVARKRGAVLSPPLRRVAGP